MHTIKNFTVNFILFSSRHNFVFDTMYDFFFFCFLLWASSHYYWTASTISLSYCIYFRGSYLTYTNTYFEKKKNYSLFCSSFLLFSCIYERINTSHTMHAYLALIQNMYSYNVLKTSVVYYNKNLTYKIVNKITYLNTDVNWRIIGMQCWRK